MSLVRDLFLWLIISFHVVGGAVLFRRYFPRESPWFGFLLPVIALPLCLNFIEHFVALPSLLWLLPFTLVGLLYVVFRGGFSWDGLYVPTAAFCLAFAFAFGIRLLNPNITPGSDGLTDLSMMLDYCHGEKIPPTDNWLPTMDYRWYYSFQHYGASVMKRMFNLDGGTALNTAHSLLSALTAVAAAAIAFRLSGGKAWVSIVMVVMIEAAFTGSSAYIYLMLQAPGDWLADNLSGGYDRVQRLHDPSPLWHLLGYDTGQFPAGDDGTPLRRELQVSGFWTWRDEFHANSSGHFFTLLSVFTVVEILRKEKSNLPWICAILIPPLIVITTMWLVIIDGILCLSAVTLALIIGRRPVDWRWVAYGIGLGLILLWPTFSDITTAPQGGSITWNPPGWRTPFWEFVVQFWPVIFLWLTACFFWKQIPVGARLVHAFIPIFLIGIELFNIENDRYNTYEKMWGPVYSAGLVCFFPLMWTNRNLLARVLGVVIMICAFVSLGGRIHSQLSWIPWDSGLFNLQGDGYLTADPQKKRMIQVLSQLRNATVLAGHCEYNYYESPAVTVFTDNRCYIAWFFSEERFGHGGESGVRTQLNNDFYAGKCKDPLGFLTANAIDAVIIWPGDKLSDDFVAQLKTQLAPTYQYEDCRQGGADNAGVFLRRPLPVIQR